MLRWSRSIADRLRSRLARILREDGGSASLEFLTVGLLMLVPLIYVVVALGQIQHQALGAEAAARHHRCAQRALVPLFHYSCYPHEHASKQHVSGRSTVRRADTHL